MSPRRRLPISIAKGRVGLGELGRVFTSWVGVAA